MTDIILITYLALESISTVIYSIILPTAIVVLLCFLPCILELKRPRDAGPKLIHPTLQATLAIQSFKIIDAETSAFTVQTKQKLPIFPLLLTNLEA